VLAFADPERAGEGFQRPPELLVQQRGRRWTRAEGDVVPGAGLEPARGFPQGIFVPLQLSLLHARSTCICGLDFTFAIPHALALRRIRQGPSSLYTFSGEAASSRRLTSA